MCLFYEVGGKSLEAQYTFISSKENIPSGNLKEEGVGIGEGVENSQGSREVEKGRCYQEGGKRDCEVRVAAHFQSNRIAEGRLANYLNDLPLRGEQGTRGTEDEKRIHRQAKRKKKKRDHVSLKKA